MKRMIQKVWHNQKYFLITFFFLALLLRLGYVSSLEEKWYFYDTRHYEKAALSLLHHGGFGKGYLYDPVGNLAYSLEPIYPLFLGGVYAVFGHHFLAVRAVQAVLTSLLLVFMFLIAEKVFRHPFVPRLVFLIGMLYPYLIFISGLLYVTAFFAFLLGGLVYQVLLFYHRATIPKSIFIGVLLALAIMCRPVVLFIVPLLILWLLFFTGMSWIQKVIHSLIILTCFFLLLVPWEVRNYKIFHRITPVRAYQGEVSRLDERYQQYQLEYGKFAGDEVRVRIVTSERENRFQVYYNGVYKGDLVDTLKSLTPSIYYAGVYLRGGKNNSVQAFSSVSTGDLDPIRYPCSSIDSEDNWFLTENMRIEGNKLVNRSPVADSWGDFAVNKSVRNPRIVALKWGEDVDGPGLLEGGLFLMVDSLSEKADGYFLIRKPTGHLSLWLIKKGKPFQGIDYKNELNSPFHHANLVSKVVTQICTMPVAFATTYFREFIRFWNPIISERIDSANSFNQKLIKGIGEFAYGLLLIFAFIGFVKLPYHVDWRKLLVLVFMLLAFALGYSLFGVRTRYRIPSDPFLIICAAAGFMVVIDYFRVRWRRI